VIVASSSDFSDLIAHSVPREDQNRLTVFADRLFAREPHDRFEPISAQRRLELTRAAFDFFASRSEPIAVRVTPGPIEGLTVVETTMPDCPFIIDSLLEYFRHLGAHVAMMLHPVYRVARDDQGKIVSLEQASSTELGESFVYAELETGAEPTALDHIAAEVRAVLVDVRKATGDFEVMTSRALQICEESAAQRGLIDMRDFLRWLVQGGFVFLGYRRYKVSGSDGAGKFAADLGTELGIMRDHDQARFRDYGSLSEMTAARRKLFFEGPPLVISKSRVESQVHRRSLMDTIAIRRSGAGNQVEAFDFFIGLFTSRAYAEESQHIPILRTKLRQVIDSEHAVPGSHDYKELVATFNSFPKEELFRASTSELLEQLQVILDLKNESAVRLKTLTDVQRGVVIALVVMPREGFAADVRVRIQQALADGLNGTLMYYVLAIGEGYTARLHFCFDADPPKPSRVRELESHVKQLAHRWEDRLRELLLANLGGHRGREIWTRWAGAFGAEYQAVTSAQRAATDIERIEDLMSVGRSFAAEVAPSEAADADSDQLRMAGIGDPPALSELMPILQNFGLAVLSEDSHVCRPQLGARRAYVEEFSVRGTDGQPLRDLPGAGFLADAIVAVREGQAEDDPLNALVLTAGLGWREVALLRAYLAAAFQMRLAPARPTLRHALVTYPQLARAMFELFEARLDPSLAASAQDLAAVRAAYLEKLGAVESIADDRTARTFLGMVEATVRTNYFCEIPQPDPYIALKFESGKIANLDDTPPLYEIHVNSPRMEGCHLRGGKVARGGIRFSDRVDDYRTEILDLMKTQTVKNAIIVPTGSKGGFVVKRPASAGPAGVEAYKTLMRAMLDLTDNATAGTVEHPPRVKVLDTDGPYLVVAADKGTAAFSDIANEIALARGFWLGDAFASGGEHGFDHKRMGITARGAWESARRHLHEMGRDPDRGAPLTMIGIGDMSGDVFGNGLLRSRNVKLIAAFDHRHIFIDPDPDPAASFAERQRLYEKPLSQWSDYNPALISRGGGVWRRGQKRIELSSEARAALGCESDALDGESLVRAILRAPADMLYNGGIGTYVRADDETDEQVGDHANDQCRVTAAELRVRVVVEGGNLGFTQRARIEYALGGGRINTDAIDNSAGVDTSDHEVNLKVLLQHDTSAGKVSFKDRNALLATLTEEVAASVLRDNRDQALMLSLEQVRSRTHLSAFVDLMQTVQAQGPLHRYESALPSKEALRERRTRYPGLTRPELAVVTAYTKIDLVQRLEGTPLLDDPYLTKRFLTPYFPESIAERFRDSMDSHRLRKELIATRMVNELVDLMGSTFVFGMMRDHGVEAWQALRAWLVAADILCVRDMAESFTAGAPFTSSGESELEGFFALERAAGGAAGWAIQNVDGELPIGASVESFRGAFQDLAVQFEQFLTAGERERFETVYRELRRALADGEAAHRLARLAFADHLLNTLGLSLARKVSPARAAAAYFGLTANLDFSRLESAITNVSDEDRWERRAAQELADELRTARVSLCNALLDERDEFPAAIEKLRTKRASEFAETARLLDELSTMSAVPMPAVHVAIRAISRLAAKK
jgi:glutamate dehydrogenase